MSRELVQLLKTQVSSRENLTKDQEKELCKSLSRIKVPITKSIFEIIDSYKNYVDTVKNRMCIGDEDIPYYGKVLEDKGLLFEMPNIPSCLIKILKVCCERNKCDNDETYDSFSESYTFILRGITGYKTYSAPDFNLYNRQIEDANKRSITSNITTHSGYKIIQRIPPATTDSRISFYKKDIPKRCFHDGDVFVGTGLPLPMTYSYKKGKHHFSGPAPIFCDIPCLYTYLLEFYRYQPEFRPHEFDTMMKNCKILWRLRYPNQKMWKVPDREESVLFGGDKTTSEMRNGRMSTSFVNSRNVSVSVDSGIFIDFNLGVNNE